MADELKSPKYISGSTVYAVVRRLSDGFVWNTAGTPAFEALANANWADYDIACSEESTTGYYYGNMPAGIATAIGLQVDFFIQAGGSPASTDPFFGSQVIRWSGSADLENQPYVQSDVVRMAGSAQSTADAVAWASRGLTMVELDGLVYRYTTNALEQGPTGSAPTAAAIADAVLDELTSEHAVSGSAGAALGRIGVGRITTVSPVAQSGDVEIVVGDDYSATDGRALDWTDVSAAWPTLTSATIALVVGDGQLTVTGSVVTATGASKKVRAEPTAAQTATLAAGVYDFQVRATLASGRVVTLVQGKFTAVDAEGA